MRQHFAFINKRSERSGIGNERRRLLVRIQNFGRRAPLNRFRHNAMRRRRGGQANGSVGGLGRNKYDPQSHRGARVSGRNKVRNGRMTVGVRGQLEAEILHSRLGDREFGEAMAKSAAMALAVVLQRHPATKSVER